MTDKRITHIRAWSDTPPKLDELKALLTLAGQPESGVSIVDRLVEAEIQRVRKLATVRFPDNGKQE
jgi:hypothetical protein